MKKELYDRIVVSSNDKMGKIIQWYFDNRTWIEQHEFHAPLESGLIVLEEEEIEITFESKGTEVELAVYPSDSNIPAMTYDFNPNTKEYSNYRFPAHLTPKRRQILEEVSKIDKTDHKEAIKYYALMIFTTYYEEIVEVDESKNQQRSKHDAKMMRRAKNQPLSLVKKTYIVKNFSEKELTAHGEKRHYAKPGREVQVRGFFRTSKNGKTSWIKPFSRYKSKGNKENKEYRI